jgi:hypothetical protein
MTVCKSIFFSNLEENHSEQETILFIHAGAHQEFFLGAADPEAMYNLCFFFWKLCYKNHALSAT